MRRFSNTLARPKNKEKSKDFVAQALMELEPRWKNLKKLKPFQLGWECLRRNTLYISYSNSLKEKWDNTQDFWERRFFSRFYATDPAFISFGLSHWILPEDEISSPLEWSAYLNPKYMAEARVVSGFSSQSRTLYLQLDEDEKVIITRRRK